MAYPIQLTIGTGNKVSVNYQSQEVNVSVTYQLESEDADLLDFTREKASEIATVHGIAWEKIRGEKGAKGAKFATRKKPKSSDEAKSKPTATLQEVEPTTQESISEPQQPLTDGQLAALEALTAQAEWSNEQTEETLRERFGKAQLNELSTTQAAHLLLDLQRAERLKTQARSQERRAATTRQNGHH